MSIKVFNQYFRSIKKKLSDSTEFTFRSELENLLNAVKTSPDISIVQESRKETFGRPDFKVLKNGLLLGYIETKPVGSDIETVKSSDQIKRYLQVIDNFLLTNYREFILFREGKEVIKAKLFDLSDKRLKNHNVEAVLNLLKIFFSYSVERIGKPLKLSKLLADKTKLLKELLRTHINSQSDKFSRKLRGLYEVLKQTLIEDLEIEEFLDTYAQTITYGLFLARLNSTELITKHNARKFIPSTLEVIEEIFDILELEKIPEDVSWCIDDIVNLLNNVDLESLHKELSFSKDKREDPYVYFYEHFLAEYDREKRKSKGVYYTPLPVVHFIVRSVEKILIERFGKRGFSDKSVKVLDFATGTGTFLLESFKRALSHIDPPLKKSFIKEVLLKNFFGFEYLIAPYTIAHLKLSQFLEEKGFKFGEDQRIGVYLTDTLDDTKYKEIPLFTSLSSEGEEANRIKLKEEILVILGNPPYNVKSRNNKPFILSLLKAYKEGLKEKNIQPLNDDYIKFIRFAQCKISGCEYQYKKKDREVKGEIKGAGNGIIGIITNNSFLDGLIHRKMRENLLKTFDEIYILNLHGNSNRGEPDENVFDIKQGVCISIFVKYPERERKENLAKVHYFSTLENGILKREDKYKFLDESDIITLEWEILEPSPPYYWFVPKDLSLEEEYKRGWSLTEIFKIYTSGIKTQKDKITIQFDIDTLMKTKEDLLNLSEEEFKNKHGISDSPDWKVSRAKKDLEQNQPVVVEIHYKPFDYRYTLYTGKTNGFMVRPRYEVGKHFLQENIGIIFCRKNYDTPDFQHILVTDKMIDINFFIRQTYIAPLYLYSDNLEKKQEELELGLKSKEKIPNFTEKFKVYIEELYGKPICNEKDKCITPEEILGYIYAILYSPTYRERYREFLKIDFPRVPFVREFEKFREISELGQKLINLHLLKEPLDTERITLKGGENLKVEKVSYNPFAKRLYINKETYLEPIEPEVFNFEIGGYKPLEKYLKSRKGRKLTFSEIEHLKKVVKSIEGTIKIQEKLNSLRYFREIKS